MSHAGSHLGLKAGTAEHEANIMLRRAMRLFPPTMRNAILEMLDASIMPSSASISHACLYLDVSFMRVMALQHKRMIAEDAVVFALTDSTEVKGRILSFF